MKVFKFGGASVSTVERIQQVAGILKNYQKEQILIVISAMGKTTNALEAVVQAFYQNKKEEALQLFNQLKQQHKAVLNALIPGTNNDHLLADFFTEVEWLLHDQPVRHYDYYYDQIVCVGELLSTAIVSHYLNTQEIENNWVDVRDILRTDNNFRDAHIDWKETEQRITKQIIPLFEESNLVITQGFIGATDDNESTTLGREGSDYSAAVFANLLNAEDQTIWKDVRGVMNADPKEYEAAQWIGELNYQEVIEMAYYGAQVIHPKTIKPLQNKNIPLIVRSFLQPEAEGTVIHNRKLQQLQPIIVYKYNQVLMEMGSKDFSFVGEGGTTELYRIFQQLNFKPNLTQNAAISFLCVVDDHAEKVAALAHEAARHFYVNVTPGLTLLTIRHYTEELLEKLSAGYSLLLKQQTKDTVQVVLQKS